MPRVLSQDLRERVVAAVDGGMSCRAAAARFGVSAASAIRRRQLVLQHGTPAAKPQGGDCCAAWIDAHAAFILTEIQAKDDITLVELQALLAKRGTPVRIGTLRRFFDRQRLTRKKGQRMPPSRTAPTSRNAERSSLTASSTSIPSGWCSSTRRGHRPTWHDAMAVADGANGCAQARRTDTGRPPRLSPACAAPTWSRRWCSTANQPRRLRCLCAPSARTRSEAR